MNTAANDALVAFMKTIRSDIIKALQFVDQLRPMPAEADATAKAVAWLMKNKDQLLLIIHDLATPKNEAVPAAVQTSMDVIHAHPPPHPLERGMTPARRKALMRLESAWLRRLRVRVATLHLGALHGVQHIFSRKDQREQEQMKSIMRSAGAHPHAPSASARPGVLLVRHSHASHSVLA
jgi:hypothetical protein